MHILILHAGSVSPLGWTSTWQGAALVGQRTNIFARFLLNSLIPVS